MHANVCMDVVINEVRTMLFECCVIIQHNVKAAKLRQIEKHQICSPR